VKDFFFKYKAFVFKGRRVRHISLMFSEKPKRRWMNERHETTSAFDFRYGMCNNDQWFSDLEMNG